MSYSSKNYKREKLWASSDFKHSLECESKRLRDKGHQIYPSDLTKKIADDIMPSLEFDIKTMSFKQRKKSRGAITDFIGILIVLFVLVLVVVISFIFVNKINESGVFQPFADAQGAVDMGINTLKYFDNLFLFVVIGLSLFVIISSIYLYDHPAFFILGFIILAVVLTFTGMISNSYYDVSQVGEISNTISNFPKMNFLMLNLPKYIFFMGVACFGGIFLSSKLQ